MPIFYPLYPAKKEQKMTFAISLEDRQNLSISNDTVTDLPTYPLKNTQTNVTQTGV
jgi:hypothetical protein